MRYYDQHMHTYFSPDSVEHFENYLEQNDKPLITTEHLDFFSPQQANDDVIPDYVSYSAEVDRLNKRYDNRLLKGIEVGFTYADRDKIQDFLRGKAYDLILLSIHHNGKHNFMMLDDSDVPLEENLVEYYDLMLEGVKHFPNANVLAHFDYGLRSYDVTVEELKMVEDRLKEIFKVVIQNGQAMELNTKSMYKHGNAHLYEYAIELYQSVGGELFTIGSDAHNANDYEYHFKDATKILEQRGVKELVVFQKQKPIMVDLPIKKVFV